MQKQAAGQVTDELKRIDAWQKQLALQTEELKRILGGHAPITLEDLQRASNMGLIEGLFVGLFSGFLTSLVASFVYGALKRKSVQRTGSQTT